MKIGDRVELSVSHHYFAHEAGDEGVIVAEWWTEGDTTMFGVELDNHGGPGDEFGWSYSNKQLEVVQ